MKHSNISIFIPHVGCPNRCSFCNQNSISSTLQVPDENVVRCLLDDALKRFKGNLAKSQIAFFGGSFTAIQRNVMISLLEIANEYVGEGKFSSIRISTRPDCIDEEILDILHSYNVKSIELGAQSMNDNILILNRRGHTSDDVIKSSKLISSRGFELGLQMMIGLYGENKSNIFETSKAIASLNPDTVRIYPTLVLKNTHLAKLYNDKKYIPMSLEDAISVSSKLLGFFEDKQIKVIKLGLHDSQTIKTDYLAGPYHPAFREICESRVFRNRLLEELDDKEKGTYTVYVNPKFISKALGQKRENLGFLSKQGYIINFSQEESIKVGGFRIEKGEKYANK